MTNEEKSNENEQTPNSAQTVLSRKMRKILDSQLETDLETQEALKELSTFFTENTLKNRRYLRGEIERRSLQINVDFLKDFEKVKEALEKVRNEVVHINESCAKMKLQIENTKSKTRDLVAQTTELQDRGDLLEKREKMVEKFMTDYQLSPEELEALQRKPIGKAFFEALQRAFDIQNECKKHGQQTTMLNIMDEMVKFQELGIQRLFKWTMDACRSTSSGLSPMDSDLLPLALSHLQKARPSLIQEVMDEYCQARKNYVTRSFLDALTLGGPGGTPKPIELHAHDPQRYVGDMLAHLHQATPMEKENVYALLKHCGPISDKDKSQTCEEALAVITDGSCRPLRSRVEQILLSEHGPLILYQLTNLIRFYNGTIGHVIPKTSSLIEMLDDLDTLAYTQFLSVLQASVTHKISPRMGMEHLPGQDLNTTPNTLGLLSLLKELLNSTTVLEEKPEQNEEIVNTILDPLLNSLNSSVASFPSIDQDVYLLNSLYQIHTTLSLFKFNDIKLQKLEQDMNLHLDTLSSEQTSSLIANLGLQTICSMNKENQDIKTLKAFLNKFDSFLIAPEDYLLTQVKLLVSSGHRKSITKRSLEVVSATYKQLYKALEQPDSLMNKTPEQVDLLLHL